jgi:DNA-binding NarL/FixJ family response regulator
MEHFFVTPSGDLRERWLQAFPHAAAVSDIAGIGAAASAASRVIWLDISITEARKLLIDVKAAVALGWPVVVMAATPDEAQAFRVMNMGAVGYCHVKAAPGQLREVALVVEHGGLWMPPELMQRFVALSIRVVPGEAPVEPELNELTSRELLVAEQIAHGATNREIAVALDISERTVKAHLSAIFDKLGVRDRVQLALAMNNIPTYTTVN